MASPPPSSFSSFRSSGSRTYPTSMVLLPFHFESELRSHGVDAALEAMGRGWSLALSLLQSAIHTLLHKAPTTSTTSRTWYYLYLVDEVKGTLVVLPRPETSTYPLLVESTAVVPLLPFLASSLHLVHNIEPLEAMLHPSKTTVEGTLVHLRAAQAALRHPSVQYVDVLTTAVSQAKRGGRVSRRRVQDVARRELHLFLQTLDPEHECSGLGCVVEPTTGVPLWTASLPPPVDTYVAYFEDTDDVLDEVGALVMYIKLMV
ncbi:hypothetical protein B5M09_010586 [Aphanomyces astaci]|nr:hypothetical protein B5M09_010586 [Aphanomyces astaci]